MLIVITDLKIENGKPSQTSTEYRYQPGSKEFVQIQRILSKYFYHRSFRSFFSDTLMEGNTLDYWLYMYSDEKSIISGGTSEITVNNHVYLIGYWGNKKSLSMMKEIRSVLEWK
jgi:hypothetical protein